MQWSHEPAISQHIPVNRLIGRELHSPWLCTRNQESSDMTKFDCSQSAWFDLFGKKNNNNFFQRACSIESGKWSLIERCSDVHFAYKDKIPPINYTKQNLSIIFFLIIIFFLSGLRQFECPIWVLFLFSPYIWLKPTHLLLIWPLKYFAFSLC